MKSGIVKVIVGLLTISIISSGFTMYKIFSDKNTYKNIEIRTTDEYVQYKYNDSDDWNNLVKLETIEGKSGREVEIKKDGNFVKWRYKGSDEWINLIDLSTLVGQDGKNGLNGVNGKDGKEIEVSTNDGYVYIDIKVKRNGVN